MSMRLQWQPLQLAGFRLEAAAMQTGEHMRITMNPGCQRALQQQLFAAEKADPAIWLQQGDSRFAAGSEPFFTRIGSILLHRGLIANLTLRENLLLPLLYRGDADLLADGSARVEEIARQIDLQCDLDEKAGERSSFIHAIISLGRCLLQQPEFIIAQGVYVGMPPDHLHSFRRISTRTLAGLHSGLLYLASSEQEDPGIEFNRTMRTLPLEARL